MADSRLLCQEGRVVGIKGHHLHVKILSTSACAQCHASNLCTSLDRTEKIIEAISVSAPGSLKIGDRVTLMMEEKWGWLAVFYGFFLPFIVMITVLFAAYALGSSEIHAALYGMGSLVPYYLLLYGFRQRITGDLVIKAEKKSEFEEFKV